MNSNRPVSFLGVSVASANSGGRGSARGGAFGHGADRGARRDDRPLGAPGRYRVDAYAELVQDPGPEQALQDRAVHQRAVMVAGVGERRARATHAAHALMLRSEQRRVGYGNAATGSCDRHAESLR